MRDFAIVALSILSLQAGCFGMDDHGTGPDDDAPIGPVGPSPTDPPAQATARGAYRVRTVFDVTANAVLPEPAYEVVATLRDFSTAPAHTLLDLAEYAGVPAVSELRAALPASLENKLEGWIDDQIEAVTINGVPVTQIAGEIAALGETTLTQFAADGELAINGPAATHRLTTIDFTPAGLDVKLPLGILPADIVAATTTARCDDGALALGDHRFGIPFGTYAWRALESVTTAQYGAGVRALLGQAVNCPAVATAVANKCVLGVCVGHRAQLTEVCERGLDEVVARAQAKVEAIRFDAIRLEAGTATLADVDAAGVAHRLTGGVWTAQIDASQGLRPVPATFTGAR
jgi:hypothetical protein